MKLVEALFTTARHWKQPKCPSAWVEHLWYVHAEIGNNLDESQRITLSD